MQRWVLGDRLGLGRDQRSGAAILDQLLGTARRDRDDRQGGGLRLNDKAEPDAGRLVTLADLVDGTLKLAAGKKKIVLIKPV